MKNHFVYGFMIALAITIISSTAWTQVFFPDSLPSTPTLGQGLFIPNEPGKSFHEARQNFLQEESKIAAADIRKGAAFLKMEAAHAQKDVKKEFSASENELEKLAIGIEKGTISSAKELDETFARAHQVLAKQDIAKASEAWTKKETAQAGHYLKAAIFHLNNALAWSGRTVEVSSRAAIKKARHVADNLITGVEQDADDVRQALDAVKTERDKLNEALSGKRQ